MQERFGVKQHPVLPLYKTRTCREYYADYDAKHENGHDIVARCHRIDERMDAAIQTQTILPQLQHNGDNNIGRHGRNDQTGKVSKKDSFQSNSI